MLDLTSLGAIQHKLFPPSDLDAFPIWENFQGSRKAVVEEEGENRLILEAEKSAL